MTIDTNAIVSMTEANQNFSGLHDLRSKKGRLSFLKTTAQSICSLT